MLNPWPVRQSNESIVTNTSVLLYERSNAAASTETPSQHESHSDIHG
jgi:hypothetical protein